MSDDEGSLTMVSDSSDISSLHLEVTIPSTPLNIQGPTTKPKTISPEPEKAGGLEESVLSEHENADILAQNETILEPEKANLVRNPAELFEIDSKPQPFVTTRKTSTASKHVSDYQYQTPSPNFDTPPPGIPVSNFPERYFIAMQNSLQSFQLDIKNDLAHLRSDMVNIGVGIKSELEDVLVRKLESKVDVSDFIECRDSLITKIENTDRNLERKLQEKVPEITFRQEVDKIEKRLSAIDNTSVERLNNLTITLDTHRAAVNSFLTKAEERNLENFHKLANECTDKINEENRNLKISTQIQIKNHIHSELKDIKEKISLSMDPKKEKRVPSPERPRSELKYDDNLHFQSISLPTSQSTPLFSNGKEYVLTRPNETTRSQTQTPFAQNITPVPVMANHCLPNLTTAPPIQNGISVHHSVNQPLPIPTTAPPQPSNTDRTSSTNYSQLEPYFTIVDGENRSYPSTRLRTFSGELDDNWLVFIAHFERKTTKLNESAKLNMFADCLTKKAAEFWISLPHSIQNNYQLLVQKFKFRFDNTEDPKITLQKLHIAKQTSTQTPEEFAEEVRLLAQGGLPHADQQTWNTLECQQFLCGVSNKAASLTVSNSNPSNLDEALTSYKRAIIHQETILGKTSSNEEGPKPLDVRRLTNSEYNSYNRRYSRSSYSPKRGYSSRKSPDRYSRNYSSSPERSSRSPNRRVGRNVYRKYDSQNDKRSPNQTRFKEQRRDSPPRKDKSFTKLNEAIAKLIQEYASSKNRSRSNSPEKSMLTCWECGKEGHFRHECKYASDDEERRVKFRARRSNEEGSGHEA